MSPAVRQRVLFVCMGNICRSPLAEGIFLHKINHLGVADRFSVDSCGTGDWHVGERPDHRIREIASHHGIVLASRARQVRESDFEKFDLIICMDEENRGHLRRLGAPKEKLSLLLGYDTESPHQEVPDPYYGGPDGFELVYRLIESALDSMLEELLAEKQ